MTKWPRDNDAELDAFYSRPDGSAKWEVTKLVYIKPPWKSYLAGTNVELKRGIRVHKKVADSLTRIFDVLWQTFGKTQKGIEAVDLHQIGGAYYFRARRGSSRLSNHARGIAIDIDPQDNPMRRGSRGDMDYRIVLAFEAEGWRWGVSFGDPMHFEAVDNGKTIVSPIPRPPVTTPRPSDGAGFYADGAWIRGEDDPTATGAWIIDGAWIIAALPLIKRWEGFRATKYWDVKQWAIGYGQKADEGFTGTITEAEASRMLVDNLSGLAVKVAPLIKVKINANQGAALLSFAYNLGVGALGGSTLLKKLNSADTFGAGNEFGKWVKAGGKTLPGLVSRRKAERELFNTPVKTYIPPPIVAPEPPPAPPTLPEPPPPVIAASEPPEGFWARLWRALFPV